MRSPIELYQMIKIEEQSNNQANSMPAWMVFLAYLAYLHANKPQPTSDVLVTQAVIRGVVLLLTVVALVAAGAPELISQVLAHWPVLP